MADSVIELWNLALSAAGGRGTISSETETGREADLCRLWYPLIRDTVLKSASWPSIKSYARLALLSERSDNTDWVNTDPAPTWRYAYAAPANMLAPRYLASYSRFDVALLGTSNAIMTDETNAILHYLVRQTDVTRWDVGLTSAVVHSLAAALARPLSGKTTLAKDLKELATEVILLARTEMANESDDNFEQLASWHEARGYETLPVTTRFVWPYAILSAIGA
jgi:hypothetical protein